MHLRRFRRRILQGMAMAVGLLLAFLALADARQVAQNLGDFPLWLFAPLIGLKVFNWACRYAEWHYFLEVVGVRVRRQPTSTEGVLSLRDCVLTYLAGFPMAMSPGKVGEILKSAIVKSLTGVPIAHTVPVVLAERLVDGLAVMLIVLTAGLLGGEAIFGGIEATGVSRGAAQAGLLGLMGVLLTAVAVTQIRPLALFCIGVLEKVPFVRRAHSWVLAFYESNYQIYHLRHLVPTVGMGLGAYLSDCVGFLLILWGFGIAPSADLFLQACFILGFGVVVAALSAMPGGAGAREVGVSALLVNLIGMEAGLAATITLLSTFFQMAFGVLVGLVVAALYARVLFPPRLEAVLDEHLRAETMASGAD